MKNSITTTKTLIICVFLFLSASAAQNEVIEHDLDSPEFAPGEILVKFQDELDFQLYKGTGIIQTNNASINLLNARFGAIEMRKVLKAAKKPDASGIVTVKGKKMKVPNLTNIYRIMFGKDTDISPIIEEYKTVPDVEYVEPNYYRYTQATIPNDPLYYKQWHPPAIDAPFAWDVTTGSSDVVIGIIDTGVKWNHPDLADNIWANVGEVEGDGIDNDGNGFIDDVRGWDFVTVSPSEVYPGEDPGPPDNDPMDFHGHGTHVSGIAGAVGNNGTGVAGVNWNVSLMALRAGYKTSKGDGLLQISDVADALVYAADNGAHIVNMSFSGYSVSHVERLAIDYCADSGVLLVAAAGNKETNEPSYPAGFENVLAVASSDSRNHRSTFSNYGIWIDVTAPGTNIYSTLVDGGYGYMSGTSMASPVAAGVAGLVKSAYPAWTADRIALQLRATASNMNADNPDFVNLLGAGLVAADQAVTISTPPVKLGVVSLWAEEVDGSSDAWFDPGETLELRPSVRNFGLAQAGVSVSLTITDPYVSILDNASFVGNMDENRIAATWDDPLSIIIASYTPQDYILRLTLEISTDDNGVVASDITSLRLNPILGILVPIVQHTDTIGYGEPQVLAKPGGEVTILYCSNGFTENQVYERSTNPSGDWMPAACISEASGANFARIHHGAVADDGSVHAVFMGVFGLYDAELFYTTQDPTDGTWSMPVQLTVNAVIWDPDITAPSTIAVDPQGHPHVVWADYRSGDAELFYMYHDGFAWSTEAVIGSPPAEPVTLHLIFDSLGIGYLLWNQSADNAIYMMELTGSTWGPPTYVTTTAHIANLSVTLDSMDFIHMVYNAPNADDVSYRQYDGTTWSSAEAIMLDTYASQGPLIATAPGDLLHVVKRAQPGFLAGKGAMQIHETVYDGAVWSSLVPITFDRTGTPYQLGLDFAIDQFGARLLAGVSKQEDIFFLSSDRDPARLPSRPSVVDDGMTTTDPFSLHASWSSSHPRGIAEYEYAIGTAPGEGDLRYWTSIGMSASITADLTDTPLMPGQAYYVSVYAIGNNGYLSPIGVSDGIYLAPILQTFAINSGSPSTTSQTVTLNNTATCNPTHYMASENVDFSGASWQIYSASPSFTLSSGCGTKTVYLKVKNASGESNILSDTIEYVTPPVLNTFAINSGSSSTTSQTVTLNNTATCNPTHYMASESSSFSGANWLEYSPSAPFTLSSEEGVKTVYLKLKNGVGESSVLSDTIEYDAPPPAPVISSDTHGEDIWSNSDDPVFDWTEPSDISGITGYSYELDNLPSAVPDTVSEGIATSKTYSDVANGTWYFHVRAQDSAGNWGSTDHYGPVKIDTTPPENPANCNETHGVQSGIAQSSVDDPSFTWSGASDNASGVNMYYYYWGSNPNGTSSDYTSVPAYDPPTVSEGTYYLRVKTKDNAGNEASWETLFVFIYATPNTPPTISGLPDKTLNEDGNLENAIDLWAYTADIETADSGLAFTIIDNTNPDCGVTIDANRYIDINPTANWHGQSDVTVKVIDPGNLLDTDTFKITVDPVNDPPVVTDLRIEPYPPGPEDPLQALYTFDDIDGDTESGSMTKWYRNGEHQPYDHLAVLPASATSLDEEWCFTATPCDGTDFGDTRTSPSVIIGGPVQEIDLYLGWNLISFLMQPPNDEPGVVLSSINTKWSSVWTREQDMGWSVYTPNGPSTLTKIKRGQGYWIEMNQSETLVIQGTDPGPEPIHMKGGKWNLVGHNSLSPLPIGSISPSMPDGTCIYTYDSEEEAWLKYFKGGPSFLNNLELLEAGHGYWLYVEHDWTINY